ncbi:MAG: hypothetical protein VX464_02165 [Pseudomonadota bacterium]|nr:hypothetical protein [Pseudomonadota bacterium]
MRVFGKIALAAVFMSLSAQAVAEDLEFLLGNETGVEIVGFYVSHPGTGSWEENLMEGDVLPSPGEVTVTIADGRDNCEYDIRTEFADGEFFEDYNLDLCELGAYVFQ